jgi:hypothetical protein
MAAQLLALHRRKHLEVLRKRDPDRPHQPRSFFGGYGSG